MSSQAEQLHDAANSLTANATDGSSAFLARYRQMGGGAGGGGARPGAMGGIRQGQRGGAPLTDKYGNLI
jgi:hypothetical protein